MMAALITLLLLAFGTAGAMAQGVPPAAPPSTAVAQLAPASDYIVGPQDVLNITVYGEPQLSGRIRVDSDGAFPFQYLGRIKAEGLTTAQVESLLRKSLEEGYLRNPQVSVEVVEYRSQSVFVTGEVRSPNKYSLPGNSTLMDVLTLAGSPLVGGTIHAIADAAEGSRATLAPLGRLVGEPDFGPLSSAILAFGEAATFGAGFAWGTRSAARSGGSGSP